MPPADDVASLLAAFIPYGMLVDLVALIGFGIALARAHRRLPLAALTGLSALLLILQLIWIAPQFVPDPRPARTGSFTVASLNLKVGGADVEQLRRIADRVDVLVLVEVTPTAYGAVRAALSARFPQIVPSGISRGNASMILSRFPLTDARELPSITPQWSATVAVPAIGPVALIAAHPCNPFCGHGLWHTEHRALLQRAEALGRRRPEVIIGDFNAVDDHLPLRRLRRHGFVSATDILGSGWTPTYPANTVVPPLLEIDHLLVNRRLTVTSLRTFRIDGTDHLGLIGRVAGT